MPKRIPKEDPPFDFKMDYARLTTRIRTAMVALVPDDWEKAAMVVCESAPESDDLIEIEAPLYNPQTAEIYEPASDELMQALEDMYLLFLPDYEPWEACEIRLEPSPTHPRMFGIGFRYPDKKGHGPPF